MSCALPRTTTSPSPGLGLSCPRRACMAATRAAKPDPEPCAAPLAGPQEPHAAVLRVRRHCQPRQPHGEHLSPWPHPRQRRGAPPVAQRAVGAHGRRRRQGQGCAGARLRACLRERVVGWRRAVGPLCAGWSTDGAGGAMRMSQRNGMQAWTGGAGPQPMQGKPQMGAGSPCVTVHRGWAHLAWKAKTRLGVTAP